MDIERVTGKYTGQPLDIETLLTAARRDDPLAAALANAVNHAAQAVIDAETDLTRVTNAISDSLTKVRDNIGAVAGQHVPTINPLGELQANAPRFDALISLRNDRIDHLRTVTRLWQAYHRTSPHTN